MTGRGDDYQVLLFRRGPFWFALETAETAGAEASEPPLPVPWTPPFVLGMATFAQTGITVLDIVRFLGLPGAEEHPADPAHLIRLARSETPLALWADQIGDPTWINPADVEQPFLAGDEARCIRGVITRDNQELLIIDPQVLGQWGDQESDPGGMGAEEAPEILEERARLFSQVLPRMEAGQQVGFIGFVAGGEHFCIPLESAREVLSQQPLVPVPRTPDCIMGLLNWHGEVLAVISPRPFLGLSPGGFAEFALILVCSTRGIDMGLMVERTLGIIWVDRNRISPLPATLEAQQAFYLRGMVEAGDELLPLLDLEKIIDSDLLRPVRPLVEEHAT